MDADFTALYQKYKNPIFTYIYYLCGDRATAEEICQDIFLKVYLNIPRFEGRSSLKTWIYRIARNTYYDFVRASNKGVFFDDAGRVKDLAAGGGGPEEHVIKNEIKNQVGRALAELPDKYRTLLILREIQQLSYKEISEVTGLNLNNVKVGIYRARKEFRKVYAGLEGTE